MTSVHHEIKTTPDKHHHYLRQQLNGLLQQRFQLSTFRPGQCEAIITLLTEKRLLCVQPTGYGKSLLYQLPSVLLPGITVVISPLLALIRDQIQQLGTRFSIAAGSINSDQDEADNARVQQLARQEKLALLFIAPEKLDRLEYVDFLLRLPISLLVVDEAHCISTWGHDFRPSYRQIVHFIALAQKQSADLHVLALTATANKQTELDIKQQLSAVQHDMTIQRHSMARPNIRVSVIPVSGMSEKLVTLEALLAQLRGVGLMYCATRENTEIAAEFLQQQGHNVIAYHAGFSPEKKRDIQRAFMTNQYTAIVATNALGMGIDKQDLRYIIHVDMPGSITAYYQEVGRCGRDGQPAQGILLFDQNDKKIQQYFIESAQPSISDFDTVREVMNQSEVHLGLTDIKCRTGLHPTRLTIVMAELVEQGLIAKVRMGSRQVYHTTQTQVAVDLSRYQHQLQTRERELHAMLRYANNTNDCFMLLLCKELGDDQAMPCGSCSVCTKEHRWSFNDDTDKHEKARRWLNQRTIPINVGKLGNGIEGVALLNGQHHAPLFVDFMTTRKQANIVINDALIQLLNETLDTLQQQYQFTALLAIPSRTWAMRECFANIIAQKLGVSALLHQLVWRTVPATRQGELLNNDQRRYNVANHMSYQKRDSLPDGAIVLLDDYIGCGATMKEAIRVLRKDIGMSTVIVPLTIASVRWRLGTPGMI